MGKPNFSDINLKSEIVRLSIGEMTPEEAEALAAKLMRLQRADEYGEPRDKRTDSPVIFAANLRRWAAPDKDPLDP